MQRTVDSSLFQELSPLVRIDSSNVANTPLLDIPWLGTIGSLDTLVPREETLRFYAIAHRQLTKRVSFCYMPGAHHGFCGMPSVRVIALADATVSLLKATTSS